MTLIVRCDTCNMDYDQAAYRRHLASPCDYGIHPLLACDLHRDRCPYPNPVWRRENHVDWTPRGYTGQPCKPLYAMRSDRVHYEPDEEMWVGTYMTTFSPDPPAKPKAPRLPKGKR